LVAVVGPRFRGRENMGCRAARTIESVIHGASDIVGQLVQILACVVDT
jgi:hypothetical protein